MMKGKEGQAGGDAGGELCVLVCVGVDGFGMV